MIEVALTPSMSDPGTLMTKKSERLVDKRRASIYFLPKFEADVPLCFELILHI